MERRMLRDAEGRDMTRSIIALARGFASPAAMDSFYESRGAYPDGTPVDAVDDDTASIERALAIVAEMAL